MKKVTLTERLLAVLKGGTDAKFTRFEAKLEKKINKDIATRKDAIASLKEKQDDANEALNDAVLNVEPSSIETSEGAEAYTITYLRNVRAKRNVVKELQNQIDAIQEEIDELVADSAAIYSAEKKA